MAPFGGLFGTNLDPQKQAKWRKKKKQKKNSKREAKREVGAMTRTPPYNAYAYAV